MKHPGPDARDAVDELLTALVARSELTETKRGIFYRKSVAFLHFHEDPAGLFADVKVGGDFERLPVNTPAERQALLTCVASALVGR